MRLLRVVPLLLVTALALGATAHAAETGSISGVVKDSQGGVLPGVVVKVSGNLLPAGRETTTTGSGTYLFPRLLPGVYRVEAAMAGMGKSVSEVRVYVDVDAQVNITLSPTATEEVTVLAQSAVVDLKNTEVNFNYTADSTQNLPLGRSYSGLFQLIPGIAQNDSSIGPAAGGSRQDNTYLMDGVNITNPGFGYLETEVNEMDIAEFNVKRGAISAEFGRSAGIVTNAVSKSGTNVLSGSARIQYQPKSFMSDPESAAFGVQPRDYFNPAIGLGGPIVKDKVFFYGSAQYQKTTQGDRVNKFGTPLPDIDGSTQEYYGKITSTPTPKHLIAASYRYRPTDTEGGSVGASSSPSVATTDKTRAHVATASWSFFVTNRTTLDLKYLYMKDDTTGDPVTKLGYLPEPFDINSLAAMGQYTDPTQSNLVVGGYEYTNRQNYRRNEIKGSVSQYFDLGKTGHQLKAGLGYTFGEEDLNRLTNGWGTISRITAATPYYRARYYFQQPSQIGQGRTWSIFAQDTMTVGSRLTLNLGVLLNQDSYSQDLPGSGGCPVPPNTVSQQPGGAAVFETDGDRCTFVKFAFGDEIQPRLGVNFNVRPGSGDKVYANWGRYNNMDQQSSSRSLAPRRIYQREARYNAATGALISDLPRSSTSGKLIDPDLKPTYNDEYLAGYATPIGTTWGLDVFYLYRNTKNFIEDVPSVLPDTGPYAAANLPCTLFPACQGAVAKRKYQAATVEINRRFANKWSANVSYTWSKFEGNFDLDYGGETAIFNTSSFIQDGPGTNVQEPYRYGPLRQDRPHVFKLFANYEPVANLMLGGYLRIQSGTPWNARGQDSQGGSALYYLEPAGSHRNPTWTNLDLLASYRFKLSGRAALVVEARAFNLFNSQTQLSTDSVKYTDTVTLDDPPYIAPGTVPNAFYGTANSFAAGRRIVLAARLDF